MTRMLEWVVNLGPYGISYAPKRAIKAHTFVDFIAQYSILDKLRIESHNSFMLYVNGSATTESSEAGSIVVSFEEHKHKHALKFMF